MNKNTGICEKYNECLNDVISTFNTYSDKLINKEQIEDVLENAVFVDNLFTEEGYDEVVFGDMCDFFKKLYEALVFVKCKQLRDAFKRLYWVQISMVMPNVKRNN